MMTLDELVRRPSPRHSDEDDEALLTREWLLANGLGGYCGGTICGACTRRYHGLLVAALPAPLGRYVMLDRLSCEVEQEGRAAQRIDWQQLSPRQDPQDRGVVGQFRLLSGLPVWHYECDGLVLEKRILMPHLQNTVCVSFQVHSTPGPIRLRLRPEMHFRHHDAPLCDMLAPHRVSQIGRHVEITAAPAPALRLRAVGPDLSAQLDDPKVRTNHYGVELARGYDYVGSVCSPGYFQFEMEAGQRAVLWASTERWDCFESFDFDSVLAAELSRRAHLLERAVPAARVGLGAELVLAADQFVIRPDARPADEAIAAAAGEEARTVIAGYPWFTDWGRDTMISLEGLTLTTGRHEDARQMLHTFSRYTHHGLLPNLFPEGERAGLYHTADATLWYFHALSRYLDETHDREMLFMLLPILQDIVDWHVRGTQFGIHVDSADGLLSQGAEGHQLTWMDAKVDGWVVTPRRGKAVEINALWYNALRLLEGWYRDVGHHAAAEPLFAQAVQARESFNRRFWNAKEESLYDVVDGEQGDDRRFRPNQIMAISLAHPVLEAAHWKPVVDKVASRLLTPVGLRTLARSEADYKATYDGDLRNRDAAYHQGTVWTWLMGPFIDAWCRVYPDRVAEAAGFVEALAPHLGEACVGTISEIFDAEAPYHPRGCVAQAWSVAEALRCWVKTHRLSG